jgi:methyl-accepting chemotaxis protein
MLELPEPGHKVAWRWWLAGVASYVVLATAFMVALLNNGRTTVASLFGFGDNVNVAIFVLVGSGLALTGYAIYRALLDIRTMEREELDVEWVHRTGRPGLLLVFVDPKKREKLLGTSFDVPESEITVETLMDDRVRRVRNASVDPNAGAVVPDDLKGVAEVRTSDMGSFARYASSLLLLLAVLGTFAGVKTALPGLIESINSSTNGIGGANANDGLIKSLNAVAEAFGGNALALIGAIAVGFIAQGIGFGRRNLLERLELVSAEFLYGQNVTADANPMQAAMVALRDTAREMHSASGAMLGIEDQLQQLGREFRGAFDALGNRLTDIALGQEEALYAKTSESLDLLQQRVNELADTIESNARTYAGLAEAVKTRSQEATHAFDAMSESNRQLGVALESIVKTGERSRESVDTLRTAVDSLTANSDQVLVEVQRVAMASEAIAPAMKQLESTLGTADKRLAESEKIAQEGWKTTASEIAKKLESVGQTGKGSSVVADGRGSLNADERTVHLLQTIASSIDQLRNPEPVSFWRTMGPVTIGVVVGSALFAGLARLV